jgi:UDP-N-acetylglucosamine 4,6-dehydratase
LGTIYKANAPVKVIGIRHGEKLYETLLTREERSKCQDLGNYYRVVPDIRDLNYEKYFSEGIDMTPLEDYNSENTKQLNTSELKEILLKLDFVRERLTSNR